MKLRILIVEDKRNEFVSYCHDCIELASEIGLTTEKEGRPIFNRARTIEQVEKLLSSDEYFFDIVIFDIGLGNRKLPVNRIGKYLQGDFLNESKIMILSGNEDFFQNEKLIIKAYENRVRYISKKGSFGEMSFENNLKKILLEIKNEFIRANIGRGAPLWKREKFSDIELWASLKQGRVSRAVLLIADISDSTRFIKAQLTNEESEHFPLEVLKAFANESSSIIESPDHQGFIERYSGDEILAYFLMPDQPDHVKNKKINIRSKDIKVCINAINAAEKMLSRFNNAFKELNTEFKYLFEDKDGSIPVPSLRILLGYGEVRWVLQGNSSRPQLSVMTNNVAECYRAFTHRKDEKMIRIIKPKNIYVTKQLHRLIHKIYNFDGYENFSVRNFENIQIHKIQPNEVY